MGLNSLNSHKLAAFGDLGGFCFELYQKNCFIEKTEKFRIGKKKVYAHSLGSKFMFAHFLEMLLMDDE